MWFKDIIVPIPCNLHTPLGTIDIFKAIFIKYLINSLFFFSDFFLSGLPDECQKMTEKVDVCFYEIIRADGFDVMLSEIGDAGCK